MATSEKELTNLIKTLAEVKKSLSGTGDQADKFEKAVDEVAESLVRLNSNQNVSDFSKFKGNIEQVITVFRNLKMEMTDVSRIFTDLIRQQGQASAISRSASTITRQEVGRGTSTGRGFVTPPAPPTAAPSRGAGFSGFQLSEAKAMRGTLGAGATRSIQNTLKSYGMSLKNITSLQRDAANGMVHMSATADDGFTKINVAADKMGKVVTKSTGKFNTFGQGIIKNIAEVAKWTIAISLVYAPMRLLNELVDEMIRNQVELANITIALGDSQRSVNQIFEDAMIAGNAVGESITGVLEGYTQAIRATGNIINETERFRVVNQLLTDSLVLSKLSALDQATAMDTLVAALRQTNTPLDEGQQLLDSWVATTKVANVDLATLATSFSITATAAKNAGVEFDELNGLIAVMAENTGLSATEVGNAVRAMVSGLDTDIARKTLREYGIEISNLEGDLFGFMETFAQISEMHKAGLIDDPALNRIAIAIGGGVRRGPQIVAEFLNLDRAQQINAATADATGVAYEALDVQLETVQSALTRVGNEFSNLSQTLGTDGGMLETFTSILEVVEFITASVTKLVAILGTAAPVLAATAVAGKVGFGAGAIGGGLLGGGGAIKQTFAGAKTYGQVAGKAFGAIAPVAFMTGINIAQGDFASAGANVAGGIAGALIAGPIGAIVGAGIAESLVNNFLTYDADLEGFFAEILADAIPKGLHAVEGGYVEGETTGATFEELETELFKVAGIGNQHLGRLAGGIAGLALQVSQLVSGEDVIPFEDARIAGAIAVAGTDPRGYSITKQIYEKSREEQATLGTGSVAQRGFITEAGGLLERNRPELDKFIEERRAQLRESLISGEDDLTVKVFTDQLAALGNLGAAAAGVVTALGSSFKDINPDIESTGDALLEVADIIFSATPAEQVVIFKLKEEVASARNAMEDLKVGTAEFAAEEAKAAASGADLARVLAVIAQNQAQEGFDIPALLNLGDVTQSEVDQILERAREITQNYLDALTPDEDQQQTIMDTWAALLLQIGDQFETLDEALPSFAINAAKSSLGFGTSAGGNTFDVRSLDFDSSRRGELDAAYQSIDALFKESFPDYEEDVQSLGVIWKDNVTDILHVDNLKLQLALNELVDLNEKQLEGIYNLPTDASFFVPFTGYRLGQGSFGGGAPTVTDPGEGGIFDEAVEAQPARFNPFRELQRIREEEAANRDPNTLESAYEIQERFRQEGRIKPPSLTEGVDFDPLNIEDKLKLGYGTGSIVPPDTAVEEVSTLEFKLVITANFQSILDGQIVATEVKTLVTDDMIRSDGRSGGLTKSYVM